MEFEALNKAGIVNLFSALGRSIELPQGIFYWTGRAKKEASINATIGSAKGPEREIVADGSDEVVTFYLPSLLKSFGGMTSEETFPYAPILGLPELRTAWREYVLHKLADRREQVEPCLTTPVITPGITGGLHVAAKLFVDRDEVVVSPDRLWGNYRNIVERNVGGRIETFPFFDGDAFNVEGMRRKLLDTLDSQTKAVLMLNFPNNPVGFSPPTDAVPGIVEALVEVVDESTRALVVLVDDAYEGYVYEEGALARSMFAELCDAHRRILPVKLDGASKEFLFYGGRIGAMTFGLPSQLDGDRDAVEAELDNKLSGLIRSTVSNCARPVQSALLRALDDLDAIELERGRVIDVLGRRAKLLKAELARVEAPGLRVLPFNAGFFCFCDLADELDAAALADRLMTEYQTAVVPVRGGPVNGVRIAFCSVPEGDIPTLAANLASAIGDLAG
ncbi:MAG: aminotransferase class I/II-fold pyridoxal phosphate-dependent enzyme [Planctomycetota bacterium]